MGGNTGEGSLERGAASSTLRTRRLAESMRVLSRPQLGQRLESAGTLVWQLGQWCQVSSRRTPASILQASTAFTGLPQPTSDPTKPRETGDCGPPGAEMP